MNTRLAATFRERPFLFALAAVALAYSLVAGLQTVADPDFFWQMATGRWVAQHHHVFSTDVFSYTANGQPWIYPVGSGLLFYAAFLVGGYALISWLGAITCVAVTAILLRRGSAATAALAIIAVPFLAARTAPRAEMFTVLLFAAYLSILWEQYEAGTRKLWLLPLLMLVWINLHLGFIAGLGLMAGYVAAELARMLNPSKRGSSGERLRLAMPWFAATLLATLANPWGWNIYRALFRQNAAMSIHSELITEWARMSFTSVTLQQALDLRDPASSGEWILLIALVAAVVAVVKRQWCAGVLLAGALVMAIRHFRFMGLLACVAVLAGGAVLGSSLESVASRAGDKRLLSICSGGFTAVLLLLVALRCSDLVSNRYYFTSNEIRSFGPALSWWYPDRAMAFMEREHLPPQVFNDYNVGGFMVWRLGQQYQDYADGRAIPFGPEIFSHLQELLQSPPDSSIWQRESETYGINTVLLSLGRYEGLKFVASALPYWCSSQEWRAIYLDEVSAVFVRRTTETQPLIDKFAVDCLTAPLPAEAQAGSRQAEFNRLANAAALLLTLQRYQEAASVSTQALSLFGDSGALWYIRGKAIILTGHPEEGERDLLRSASLEVNVATWSELANLYRSEHRYGAAENALKRLSTISPDPTPALLMLGYTYLEEGKVPEALTTFNGAEKKVASGNSVVRAEINHGRASAYDTLGDLGRAVASEEAAVRLSPQNQNYWNQLASLYRAQGRVADADQAAERAAMLSKAQQP